LKCGCFCLTVFVLERKKKLKKEEKNLRQCSLRF
jgi:hypothetical protein